MTTQKSKILVIDDDAITRRILFLSLRGKNYDVVLADEPSAGLELAVQQKPSLIILDVFMPNVDGWSILAQLRNIPETQMIPVLMLTAANQIKSVETAFSLGANAYLSKPFDAVRLHKKVSELIDPLRSSNPS